MSRWENLPLFQSPARQPIRQIQGGLAPIFRRQVGGDSKRNKITHFYADT